MQGKNISPFHIRQYLENLQVSASGATLARKKSSLKRFLTWAQKAGYLIEAPEAATSAAPETAFVPLNSPSPVTNDNSVHRTNQTPFLSSKMLALAGGFIFVWSISVFWLVVASKQSAKVREVEIPIPTVTKQATGRYIPFVGRLLNSNGYQVGETLPIVFTLYDKATGGNQVWSSQRCLVGPEEDGSFSVTLGATSGVNFDCSAANDIPAYLFYENSGLWLSMAINDDQEINPRIPIATVANSQNSQTLGGFTADTAASENTIPVINQNGDLVIASTLPKLRSTSLGSSLVIEGQGGLVLSSSDTSNSPITLSPGGVGNLNLLFKGSAPISNGFINASNANMAGGALYYGEVGNDLKGYNLMDLQAGSTLASKFSVDSAGNTLLAGTLTVSTIESASGTPLVVDTNGRIFKESSSTKYKTNIENFTDDYKKILALSPSKYKYIGRNELEIGYLAENLDRMGLKTLVVYNELGEAEGIKYDKIPLYLLPIVKEQEEKLKSLFTLLSPVVDEKTISVEGKLTANEVVAQKITAQEITADLITDSKGNKVVSEEALLGQKQQIQEIEDYLKNSVSLDIDALKALADKLESEVSSTSLTARDLYVTGTAIGTNFSVSDNLTIGADFSITSNNLNTLSQPLKIQSLAQASVEIMGGLVVINQNGNVEIKHDLKVAGALDATSINSQGINLYNTHSANPSETPTPTLTLSATGEAVTKQITTQKLVLDNPQAGISGHAVLEANSLEVEIVSPQSQATALISVVPTTSTFNNVLYIKTKKDGSFVVSVTQKAPQAIEFDWLILQIQNKN